MQGNRTDIEDLLASLRRVLAVPDATLEVVLATVIAGGHLLIEDVPGVGKTLLAKTLASALGLGFRRVQFTPDLLAGDLLGASLYVPSDGSFRFAPGPVFTHVLLADEINRASPRTQSGLLEAMEEAQVSLEGKTYPLPDPFFVIATQNPLTFEGTFPLPEVQLDRFMATVCLGYPSYEDEFALLEGRHGAAVPLPESPSHGLAEWKLAAKSVHVSPALRDYLLAVVRASRVWPGVKLGVSPRGALAWQALARAYAILRGRDFLVPDDLKATASWALSHRLVLDQDASMARKRQVISELLAQQPVPR